MNNFLSNFPYCRPRRLRQEDWIRQIVTENFLKISESGISSAKEISILREHGFKGFLIGETFMKEKNPGKEVLKMINEIR